VVERGGSDVIGKTLSTVAVGRLRTIAVGGGARPRRYRGQRDVTGGHGLGGGVCGGAATAAVATAKKGDQATSEDAVGDDVDDEGRGAAAIEDDEQQALSHV